MRSNPAVAPVRFALWTLRDEAAQRRLPRTLGLTNMNPHDIEQMVLRLLSEYRYQPPEPGTTVGVPWSSEKVGEHAALLKQSLVPPRLERFTLAETYEQIQAGSIECANYWVVAERSGYLEWYDPTTNEFGLGQRAEDGGSLVSIGVRGDLVGVFCAM